MINNFYTYFVGLVSKCFENINPTTRIKRFVFWFIAVVGKWKYGGRSCTLKLYTTQPYEKLLL